MSSPESIFHWQYIVFTPDDKTGGDTSRQFQQQDSSSNHFKFSEDDPVTSEGTLIQNTNLEESLNGSYVIGKDDFVWDESLSENGQKLWRWLLAANKIDFLKLVASEEGWDLETAIEEVRSHGLLEECEPGYFRIIREKL